MASPQSIALRTAIEAKRYEKERQYAVREKLGQAVYEDGQLKDFIQKWLEDYGNIDQALQYVADKYYEDFGHDKGRAEDMLRQTAHRLFVDDPNTPQNEGWNSNNWTDLSREFLENSKPIMLNDLKRVLARRVLIGGQIDAIEGEIKHLVGEQGRVDEVDTEVEE